MCNDFDIGRRISVISNKIRHIVDASFANSGITGTQASILHFIYMNGKHHDVFQRDIEAEFSIRRSSVTSVLHGLERNGFIQRETVEEDARLRKIVLKDKAIAMITKIREEYSNINDIMLKQLKLKDIARLDALLAQIEDNMP